MDIRQKLLRATARVYAETGYRGATTRRIAQEAGVNEITLFRHFGSKDALIKEALDQGESPAMAAALPDVPSKPAAELVSWCIAQFEELYAQRSIIRKVMGEIEEHPEIVHSGMSCPRHAGQELLAYLTRLRDSGMSAPDIDPRIASRMLMSAVFSEAMSRDIAHAAAYAMPVKESMRAYVDVLLRAILTDKGMHRPRVARAGKTSRPRPKGNTRH
ncbi:MAG: TetR/AcrR family transcriptional regulator [Gemmatimonadota bacterium]|nr:TetR/AcrR family transcriptional regulator [Gemmatimonadota bacterium]